MSHRHPKREEILDLWAAGMTASNIARRLGIGNKEWASNIIKRARVSGDIRAVRRKPTPDEIERARANECA